jgi:hypothetical protein
MVDLTQVIINFGQSLEAISNLVAGLSYLMGILFIFGSLDKLRDLSMRSGRQADPFVPMCFFLGGAGLLYLPTYIDVLSYSFFGQETNPLSYYTDTVSWEESVTYYVIQMIEVGGLFFFIRGTVLMMEASLPGSQHGLKGLAFLFGGILMMNFQESQELLSGLLQEFYAWRSSSVS